MISPFLSWCAAQGIITPLEYCDETPSYRYTKCIQPSGISPTGPILRVPLSACIVAPTTDSLTELLADERRLGPKSIYAPYIDVLPPLSSFQSDMPRFWSDNRVEMVTAADGGQMLRKMREDARSDLDPWAHACVTSRANYVQGHGFAMTPVLDMINHDGGCGTRAGIVEDELFLSVDRAYAEGDEVFISYGDLTNIETLCNYGFVVSTEEDGRGEEDGTAPTKTTFNEEAFDVSIIRRPPVKVIVSDVDGSFDADALAALRSFLVTPEQLERRRTTDDDGEEGTDTTITTFTNPVSEESEEDVYCLVTSFLVEAVADANLGIERAKEEGDGLVERYLRERVKTLQKGLLFAGRKFPSLVDF